MSKFQSLFYKGVGYLLLSVFIYSSMPVLIRGLSTSSVPPAAQVFLRYIVACLCACIYVVFTKQKISISKKQIPLLLLVGVVGYALTNLLYTYAILLTQVGTVLFIFYGLSAVMPIVANVFLKEKITQAKMVGLLLGSAALFFLFRPGPIDTWKAGALFAFASAVAQGVYVIGRKKLNDMHSSTLLLTNTVLGVICVGIISFVLEGNFYASPTGLWALSPSTWMVTIIFGIGNFLAWLFLTKGFQLVSAGAGSLVMLSENFIGVLFAFMFFGEIPTVWTLLGGLLVLAASLIVIMEPQKK